MEDDKDLELSLGLFCGGSSNQSKAKSAPSNSKADEASNNRLCGGNNSNSDSSFKAFFNGNQDQKEKGTNSTDPQQHDLSHWNLSNKTYNDDVQTHLSQFKRYQELWAASNNKPNTGDDMSNKRKISFEDTNIQNKQKVVEHEDASSAIANNEDVTESETEAEGRNNEDSFVSGNNNSNQESGKVGYGIPSSLKPINMTNNVHVMQLVPAEKSDGQNMQAVNMNLSSSQLSFGYSLFQLPTLETGSSWAFNSQPKTAAYLLNRDGTSAVENVTTIIPSIKPGIASEVKFGGSGSYPDLPWVSTTGPGPNGKTISGVTYKYTHNQLKIVCACHGIHMSPQDFVLHATTTLHSDHQGGNDANVNSAGVPNNIPAASTKG